MHIAGLALEVDGAGVAWRSTSYPGVEWLPLHVGAEGAGAPGAPGARETAVLIRMAPGRGYPAHRHVGVEDVLILQGGYRDQLGEHRSGTYLRYEAGSSHAPVALGRADRPVGAENPACILFAVARGGIELVERHGRQEQR